VAARPVRGLKFLFRVIFGYVADPQEWRKRDAALERELSRRFLTPLIQEQEGGGNKQADRRFTPKKVSSKYLIRKDMSRGLVHDAGFGGYESRPNDCTKGVG
jgi:hypothetical protein